MEQVIIYQPYVEGCSRCVIDYAAFYNKEEAQKCLDKWVGNMGAAGTGSYGINEIILFGKCEK